MGDGRNATPQVALPSDLSRALRHLDDDRFEELRRAVLAEADRRGHPSAPKADPRPEPAPGAAGEPERPASDEITLAQANLVRAAHRAGLKPAAIARRFGLPPAAVRRVLAAAKETR